MSRPRLAVLLALLVLAAACGGSSRSAPPAALAGTLRVPEVAPAVLPADALAAEARLPMRAGEVLVWLEPGAAPPDLSTDGLDLLRAPGGPIAVYRARAALTRFTLDEGAAVEHSAEYETCRAARAVAGKPGVRCAAPNQVLQHCLQPNDTFFDKQWHYPQINLPQAWDLTTGSASVIVAVLDTGIVSAHPEFQGRLIPGYDMISDPASARDGNGRDPNPEDTGDLATPQGSSFHGTHVAGTIGANGHDGQGIAGVDWSCRIMPVRVLGRGGGTVDDIAAGILFAARLANGSGALPAQRADIVNMSLGGPGLNAVLQQACNAAAAAGCLLVAAAGNDNSGTPSSPAAFDSVLSVGAIDLQRARAPYSNFHTSIDLWAPGGDMTADRNGDQFPDGVLSCMANDQGQLFFKFENGTSMAAPHVAGVAALVKAANPALTAAQIRTVLLGTTAPGVGLPNGGRVVDALAAVLQAGGSPPTDPVLVATPSALDFGAAALSRTVVFENRGAGELQFVGIQEQPPAAWLFQPQLQDGTPGNGIDLDEMEVVVDRTGLADGVYVSRIVVTYQEGSTLATFEVAIDVRMQVGASTVADDTLFVLLVDPITLDTRFQVETTLAGAFAYAFAGVPAGDYLLVAGTDRDGDDFLGDDGELFGAWPNLDTPLILRLAGGEDLTGLDFGLQELATVPLGERPARPAWRRLR
ncbi:MAG: S8 family serine peptidase [Planctomycetes bacterium]|nr:S8 family serine peptidase [Planctomycetota bacterium]